MSLDTQYHLQLKKMLELLDKIDQQAEKMLSGTKECMHQANHGGQSTSISDVIELWNNLQVHYISCCACLVTPTCCYNFRLLGGACLIVLAYLGGRVSVTSRYV